MDNQCFLYSDIQVHACQYMVVLVVHDVNHANNYQVQNNEIPGHGNPDIPVQLEDWLQDVDIPVVDSLADESVD